MKIFKYFTTVFLFIFVSSASANQAGLKYENFKSFIDSESIESKEWVERYSDTILEQVEIDYKEDKGFVFTNGDLNIASINLSPKTTKTVNVLRYDSSLFSDVKKDRKVYNLTEHLNQEKQTLEVDKFGNGFLVSREFDITANLNPLTKISWSGLSDILGSIFLPYISLSPIKGIGRKEVRYVKTKEEAKKLRGLFLPTKKVDVDNMKNGESVTFRTQGGRIFTVGIAGFGIGTRYVSLVRGTWETSVRKISDTKLLLTQTNINIDEDGHKKIDSSYKEIKKTLHAGNFLFVTKAEVSHFKKSRSYLVDIKDEEARTAYLQFITGNELPLEELSQLPNNQFVAPYQSIIEEMKGKYKKVGASFPFIFKYRKTKGQFYTDGIFKDNPRNKTQDYKYSVAIEHKYKKTAGTRKNKTTAFIGAVTKTKDNKDDYFGRLVFEYTNNKAKEKLVRKRIKEIVDFTGLKEVEYKVPEVSKKLGYFSFSFTLDFPKMTTNFLMNLAKVNFSKEKMAQLTDRMVDTYLLQKDDEEKECQNFDEVDEEFGGKELEVEILEIKESCSDMLKLKSKEIMVKAIQNLKDMKTSLDNNQAKAFTENYAKFGKNIMKNKFVFQGILNLIKGRGVNLKLLIGGERVSLVKKAVEWVPQKSITN